MDRGAEIGTIPEEAFSFDGYQVVRGEFFAHTFEPSITFCGSKLYVNMACLNKLPTVENTSRYLSTKIQRNSSSVLAGRMKKILFVGAAIPQSVNPSRSSAAYSLQNWPR